MAAIRNTADSGYARRLVTAFFAMALAFIASSIITGWRTSSIERETTLLRTNALPSIERLIVATDLLRDLEATSDDYPDLAPDRQSAAREAIERARAAIDHELEAYQRLPEFQGERELFDDVPASLRKLDGSLARLFDQIAAQDTTAARLTADREVRVASNSAASLIRELVKLNSRHAYSATTSIEATRQSAAWLAVALNIFSVVLGGAAAFWLWRLFRVHASVLRTHGEMVERRADELEIFGTRVAHDLLSPLSALTYCLSAFNRASESDPALKDAIVRARACVKRAQGMVDGIFEFARSGGRPEAGGHAEIDDVVAQVAEEVREAEAVDPPTVVVEPFEPRAVACPRGVLASVLSNLTRNAAKFMRDSTRKQITIRVRDESAMVHIEVEDTGPGVPPGLEGVIFEQYARAEGVTQPGIGLGLATVKRLCEAYGGAVGVRSSAARGAIFWVTLPRHLPLV